MIFYAIFVFIFGLAIGSFLNVLIDRLPQGRSIMGRSHCDFCHKKLRWYDLIPVFSFIILAGRCRNCKKKLSFFYPAVELLTGIIFLLVVGRSFSQFTLSEIEGLRMTIELIMVSCLIVIFFADLKYQIIPDSMQILFFLSIVSLRVIPTIVEESLFSQILLVYPERLVEWVQDDIISGFLVMSPILFLFLITRGRGMGFGDVKYAFSMGFLLGIKGGLIAIYIAFILGALVGVFLLAAKKKKLRSKIAFGPFLVLGTVAVLKWGTVFFDWFRSIYGL